MQIRKIGPQPEDNFLIMPNASIRDSSLSYRARGLMAVISSHSTGFHISSEELAEGGTEGVRAIRTAMNELIARNYMRRIRSQDAAGRWRTDIDVYIWGNAPDATTGEVIDDDFGPQIVDAPATDGPKPPVGEPEGGFRPAVTAPVGEDHPRKQSPTSPSSAAAPDPSTTGVVEGVSRTRYSSDTVPMVLQRRLRDMGVVDGTQWTTAWQAATGLDWPEFAESEAERYPEEHLTLHLMAQQEQGRTPSPSRWMRFYIEDRNRRIQVIAANIEQEKQMRETPQEREDRLNRRLPPDWGAPAAAPEAATTAGEQS